LLTDIFAVISLHAIKSSSYTRTSTSIDIINDFEDIRTVEVFIFCFIKTQDLIGLENILKVLKP